MYVTQIYVFNQNLSTDEVVVVPITAVITAVTAVLPPSLSLCHSLLTTARCYCYSHCYTVEVEFIVAK